MKNRNITVVYVLPTIFIFQRFLLIFHADENFLEDNFSNTQIQNFVIFRKDRIPQRMLKSAKSTKYNPHKNIFIQYFTSCMNKIRNLLNWWNQERQLS